MKRHGKLTILFLLIFSLVCCTGTCFAAVSSDDAAQCRAALEEKSGWNGETIGTPVAAFACGDLYDPNLNAEQLKENAHYLAAPLSDKDGNPAGTQFFIRQDQKWSCNAGLDDGANLQQALDLYGTDLLYVMGRDGSYLIFDSDPEHLYRLETLVEQKIENPSAADAAYSVSDFVTVMSYYNAIGEDSPLVDEAAVETAKAYFVEHPYETKDSGNRSIWIPIVVLALAVGIVLAIVLRRKKKNA